MKSKTKIEIKAILDFWEEQDNSFQARVQELYGVMVENGALFIDNWMAFSDKMVERLEKSTIEEYNDWRISLGKMSLFPSTIRKGKEQLLEKLREQRKVDIAAYEQYKIW